MAPRNVTTAVVAEDPQTYEDLHVHSVYDEIAPHFSSTRYKVSTFACRPVYKTTTDLILAMAHHRRLPIQSPNGLGGTRFWNR